MTMDYTIIYMLAAILAAVGITFTITKLRLSGKLKQEDLLMAIRLLNLSLKVVSELRLDKEKEILSISELVIDGLEYAVSHFDTEQDIILNAYEFALEIGNSFNMNLTEERKDLLRELIIIVFENSYKPLLENE